MEAYGEVAPETVNAIAQMRERANLLLREMGKLEFQKIQMSREIGELENRTNGMLKLEAERLEIPEGATWSLTPEGKAIPVEE